MDEATNQRSILDKLFKTLRSGKIVDLLLQASDYTFMFVSIPIVGSITITLLSNLINDRFDSEISLITISFISIFLLVGYYLNKGKTRRGPSKKLNFDDWTIEIFLKSIKYVFYFLYSASLTALIVSFFNKQFGSEINRQITELLPDIVQIYFYILFIILPIFVILVSVAVLISIKTEFHNPIKQNRILLFISMNLPVLIFGIFLESFDYTKIDIDRANSIVTFLVGPLILYNIRVLFFRKWINFNR